METPFLRYSEKIDQDIIPAVENELGVSVKEVKKTPQGEFNYSYIIKTETDPLIARVFRERNDPPDGKLEWIEERLTENKIPHAKMIYYSRDDTYFQNGFMVSEFLAGKDGKSAIMDGDISFEEFFNKLVPLLKKVHSIETVGFGEIRNGRGEYDTYFDYHLGQFEKTFLRIKNLDVDPSVHDKVLAQLQKLQQFKGMFNSVLLHGDPPPGNSILKPDGQLILIDWDNAKCSSWIDEYVGLATRGAFMWQHSLSEEERNKIIQRAFKNNYTGVDFEGPDLLEVMKTLEILNAYSGIAVHYFQHENMELYKVAKQRLDKLLVNT